MENAGEKRAKRGMEAFTFFSVGLVPNPSFLGGQRRALGSGQGDFAHLWTGANSRLVPAGKERDESKGGPRETVGGKL